MMAGADEETSSGLKHPDMVLMLGSKSENFLSDQTPTPIRLIQKCEEIGIFKDFQNVNPFEETFRKAAEDIRSGTTPLEMTSLSVPNNTDDSLHTPHVIFPLPNDLNRRKAISPRDDLSISDPLSLSLDNDESDKMVVQQEADTSEEAQLPNLSVAGPSDAEKSSFGGTIQFLLRMPNGKMVQLSTHPVEQLDNTLPNSSKEKDIPLIKVDSSFLKAVGGDAKEDSPNFSSAVSISGGSGTRVSQYEASVNNAADKISSNRSNPPKQNSMRISDAQEADQISKMSLAKQKLKEALMNNTCPATSSVTSSTIPPPLIPHPDHDPQAIQRRRLSSPSDDGVSQDTAGHDPSSVDEKRRRNRAAAMRCREKRKTWVKELERRANDMMRTNGQLQHEVSMLRDEVAQLKTLLLAHRDCPVTQALVEGKATLPIGIPGTLLPMPISEASSQNSKGSPSKEQKYSPSAVVFQTPSSSSSSGVKPRILLNDPPIKRKRLNSSTTITSPTAVSVVSSPVSGTVHTVMLPSKSSNVLNPSYVNVIPSVVVANPANPSGTTLGQQVIYPQLLTCLPTIAPKPDHLNVVTSQQTYILPKVNSNLKSKVAPNILGKLPVMKHFKPETKVRSAHFLSTNVIKINPNVVDRDTNDSDIEILDVK